MSHRIRHNGKTIRRNSLTYWPFEMRLSAYVNGHEWYVMWDEDRQRYYTIALAPCTLNKEYGEVFRIAGKHDILLALRNKRQIPRQQAIREGIVELLSSVFDGTSHTGPLMELPENGTDADPHADLRLTLACLCRFLKIEHNIQYGHRKNERQTSPKTTHRKHKNRKSKA